MTPECLDSPPPAPRTAFTGSIVAHISAGIPAAVLEKESRRGGIAPSPTGGCANRPFSTRQRYLNMHCAPLHAVCTAKCDSPTLSHKASAMRRNHSIYAVMGHGGKRRGSAVAHKVDASAR